MKNISTTLPHALLAAFLVALPAGRSAFAEGATTSIAPFTAANYRMARDAGMPAPRTPVITGAVPTVTLLSLTQGNYQMARDAGMPTTMAVEKSMQTALHEPVVMLHNGNGELLRLPDSPATGGTLTHFSAKGKSRSVTLDAKDAAAVNGLISSGKLDSAYDTLAQKFDGSKR